MQHWAKTSQTAKKHMFKVKNTYIRPTSRIYPNNYFRQKASSYMFDRTLNTPHQCFYQYLRTYSDFKESSKATSKNIFEWLLLTLLQYYNFY